MDSPRKNNDCYFYYYSTCLKGDGCLFRHEPSALGCETVCTFWQQGKCLNQHCQFRHMELRKNRKIIPCYWENQPGGCRKPHCSFLHKLPREPIGGELEKAKECDSVAAGKPLDRPEWPRRTVLTEGAQFEECVGSSDNDSTRVGPRRVSQSSEASYGSPPVDPLVVNFEEESDNESVPTSTPTKKPQRNIHVKTLEEIRLERIQAESAAFYSYDHNSEQIASNDLRSWIDTRKMYHKSAQDFKVLSLEEIRKSRFAKENCEVNVGDGHVQNTRVSSHQQVENNKFNSGIDSENNNGVECFIGIVGKIKKEVEESSCAANGFSEFLPKVEGGDVGKSQTNSHVKGPSLKRSHSPITFDTSPKKLASEITIKMEVTSSSVSEEDCKKVISEEQSCDLKRTRDLNPLTEGSQPLKKVRKLVRRTQECERPSRRRLRRGNVMSVSDSSDVAYVESESLKNSEVLFQVPLVDKVVVDDINGPLQDSPAASGNLPQDSQNSETIVIQSTMSSDSQLVTDNVPERELSLQPETIVSPVMDRSNRCSIESVDEEMFLDVQDTGMTLEADEDILQDIDDLLKD